MSWCKMSVIKTKAQTKRTEPAYQMAPRDQVHSVSAKARLLSLGHGNSSPESKALRWENVAAKEASRWDPGNS